MMRIFSCWRAPSRSSSTGGKPPSPRAPWFLFLATPRSRSRTSGRRPPGCLSGPSQGDNERYFRAVYEMEVDGGFDAKRLAEINEQFASLWAPRLVSLREMARRVRAERSRNKKENAH